MEDILKGVAFGCYVFIFALLALFLGDKLDKKKHGGRKNGRH